MGEATYQGYTGGLYPGASNEPPADHAAAGYRKAALIQPLNADGLPDPGGKYVMLSVGMSNTNQEFCGNAVDGVTCDPESFMGLAAADPLVEHDDLALVNGAAGGQTTGTWASPDAANYDRIRDDLLSPLGLSEAQVQVVWVKVANRRPSVSLPAENADAHRLVAGMGRVVRALHARYPNLQMVFLSSRIYAGYATTTLNPEPYAYESGFAVKWLIEAQIEQMRGGEIDPLAGDLDYETAAPWLGWGPYLWADGMNPRSDGLAWAPEDFLEDGTHPSIRGVSIVGGLLMDFFSTSPLSGCWFLAGLECTGAGPVPVWVESGFLRIWWPSRAR